MDNRAIGVFDSGLGGLTAVKELMCQLPNEKIIYFGDTGRVPYGTRSNETITKYVFQDVRFLEKFDVKMIVVACGTASAVALTTVQEAFDIPILGVVESAVKKAVSATKNGKIGVIGTQGTVNSGAYERMIKAFMPDIDVLSVACPMFVPLVENGYLEHRVAEMIAVEYFESLLENRVDTLVLGCTHYPLLHKTISKVMGEGVTLIDPGAETAKTIRQLLITEDKRREKESTPTYQYFVSDSVENFSRLGSVFLQQAIDHQVQKIDIEKY